MAFSRIPYTGVRADEIPSNAGHLYAICIENYYPGGYMLAPSAYEIGFISTAHDESHIRGLVNAIDESLEVLEW